MELPFDILHGFTEQIHPEISYNNCDGPAPILDFQLISVGFDLSGYKMLLSQL